MPQRLCTYYIIIHASPHLQGWQTERVVQRNASSGRILLVMPHDPAAHQRKARSSACVACQAHAAFVWPCMWIDPFLCHILLLVYCQAHVRARTPGAM